MFFLNILKVLVITWRHGSCKIKFIYIFFFLRADNFWLRLDVVIFDPHSELILFLTFSFRSSHWRSSVKKGVLRNFAKFTGNWLSDCFYFFFQKPYFKCVFHVWVFQVFHNIYRLGWFVQIKSKSTYFLYDLQIAVITV